jgi:hypothetical protein
LMRHHNLWARNPVTSNPPPPHIWSRGTSTCAQLYCNHYVNCAILRGFVY